MASLTLDSWHQESRLKSQESMVMRRGWGHMVWCSVNVTGCKSQGPRVKSQKYILPLTL